MRRRNIMEIGSVLYVRAALRIDELYVPANLDDHIWFEERKRHHKRLWMRLMRSDFLSARTTLNQLCCNYSNLTFDKSRQTNLDHEIISFLLILIEKKLLLFELEDQFAALQIIKLIA